MSDDVLTFTKDEVLYMIALLGTISKRDIVRFNEARDRALVAKCELALVEKRNCAVEWPRRGDE